MAVNEKFFEGKILIYYGCRVTNNKELKTTKKTVGNIFYRVNGPEGIFWQFNIVNFTPVLHILPALEEYIGNVKLPTGFNFEDYTEEKVKRLIKAYLNKNVLVQEEEIGWHSTEDILL